MGNFKKMILGEEMPDKDDPKYKEKYEKDVEAGRKFAQITKIDKGVGYIQRFALRHRNLFLVIVFGFVISCLAFNIYNMVKAYNAQQEHKTATERQEEMLREIKEKSYEIKP
ncbi:MAG: hypothetical protein IKV80_10530 [Bacteroidales bacterium]|nr:hypothetical protein [Bacteroidales bacterium]